MKKKLRSMILIITTFLLSQAANSALVVGAASFKDAVKGDQFAKDVNQLAFKSAQVSAILYFITLSPTVGSIFLLDEKTTVASVQDHLIAREPFLSDMPELSFELSKLLGNKISNDEILFLDKNEKVQIGAISLSDSEIERAILKTNSHINEQDYKNLVRTLK